MSFKGILKRIYQFLIRQTNMLRAIWLTPAAEKKNKPIYIFNHVPKCGGTTLSNIFRSWFVVVRDYPPHDVRFPDPDELKERMSNYQQNPVALVNLKPWHILTGHFHDTGFQLNYRYGKAMANSNVRIISFLRDPLDHRLSLYYYAQRRKHNWVKNMSVKQFIVTSYHQNYFARALECNETNYEVVLSKYYFIGIVEDFDLSIQLLSRKIGRPNPEMIPHLNKTERKQNELTEDEHVNFRSLNELDYKMYEFAKKMLHIQ